MAAHEITYCQKSSAAETDWEKLYEVAFRPDQRTPLAQLQQGLQSGQMLLHRTVHVKDGLLCFSVTNILPTIGLLAYLATDPSKRSGGIGSRHMKQLIAQVRSDHPNMIALFAEIESTREKGIDEETKKHRRRRLRFYQRLGFKRYKQLYTIPSYDPNVHDEEGELIWLEFNGALAADKVAEAIKEIYIKAYLLKEDDARIKSIPALSGSDHVACDIPDSDSADAATTATPAPNAPTVAPDATGSTPATCSVVESAAVTPPGTADGAEVGNTVPEEKATQPAQADAAKVDKPVEK